MISSLSLLRVILVGEGNKGQLSDVISKVTFSQAQVRVIAAVLEQSDLDKHVVDDALSSLGQLQQDSFAATYSCSTSRLLNLPVSDPVPGIISPIRVEYPTLTRRVPNPIGHYCV